MIVHIVGDDLASIVHSAKPVWVPAHKSHLAIGASTKSDGECLTTVDWRANRLVDCLAKAAATSLAAPRNVSIFPGSADAAAAHAACLLGVVTHSANNFWFSVVGDGGATTTTFIARVGSGTTMELATLPALLRPPLWPSGLAVPKLSSRGVHPRPKCRSTA